MKKLITLILISIMGSTGLSSCNNRYPPSVNAIQSGNKGNSANQPKGNTYGNPNTITKAS